MKNSLINSKVYYKLSISRAIALAVGSVSSSQKAARRALCGACCKKIPRWGCQDSSGCAIVYSVAGVTQLVE
ncbi:MAG: hypothetical protein N3E45_08820 [Oscillatoriaceae bacterium SKW80]|nr:hypothetical protein [Oscillatoriaceae bacterium SKYG93]MCX8120919.1 hypothetical protein [Oscillatoriaceae bacterium SKW80]MDW8452192.1 hypothetical protein [Oscillatoriaceae cyanobacterium SKYGB_i_bin93]HIK26529.1 hypothetical protein [Oscillatoriaceae cyanobacterium M7585_C2015_266]